MAERWTDHGVACPCCDQECKVYPRQIHCTMARALIGICDYFGRNDAAEWCDVATEMEKQRIRRTGGDIPKLRFWGLLVGKREEREDGSPRNGYWRITGKGVLFVQGRLRVPKVLHVYNNRVVRCDEQLVDIRECLGKRFSYAELMTGIKWPRLRQQKLPGVE